MCTVQPAIPNRTVTSRSSPLAVNFFLPCLLFFALLAFFAFQALFFLLLLAAPIRSDQSAIRAPPFASFFPRSPSSLLTLITVHPPPRPLFFPLLPLPRRPRPSVRCRSNVQRPKSAAPSVSPRLVVFVPAARALGMARLGPDITFYSFAHSQTSLPFRTTIRPRWPPSSLSPQTPTVCRHRHLVRPLAFIHVRTYMRSLRRRLRLSTRPPPRASEPPSRVDIADGARYVCLLSISVLASLQACKQISK